MRLVSVVNNQRLDAIRDQLRCDGRRWTVAKSELVQALLVAEAHLSARSLHEEMVGSLRRRHVELSSPPL